MKKICIKAVSTVLAVLLLFGTLNVSALNFNGATSGSGDGSSATASTGGYAVPNMLVNNSNRAVGYRFSVCNSQGSVAGSPVDMYREAAWTSDGIFYAGYYKFDSKRTKTELKSIYTYTSFSTSGTTSGCCHDSNLGLALPNDTTGLQGWSTEYNIGVVLRGCWGYSVTTLIQNAWAVLIEPIFPVKIQGTYHCLTPTEMAVYGASKFGAGSRGNSCNNSNSWGFIAYYTNRHLPNALRLATGYMGMPAAGYASSCLSFSEIINYGYGAAIVYGDYLSLAPSVVRWTFYQPSWQGFYVYVYTERVSTLYIPTWTEANGQDELIWYNAIRQDNTVRGQYYNWVYFVPLSEHNNEKGAYITHFYGYHANGNYSVAGSSYEPPKVPQTKIKQTDNDGFYVYANIQSANRLSVPVWTDYNWQDELKWYPATNETNVVDGVTYHWKVYIPFSEHFNERGLYYIDYYAANDFSEGLCGASDKFIPEQKIPDLLVDYCDVFKGEINFAGRKLMGTSSGPTEEQYEIKNGYLELYDAFSLRVRFQPDSQNSYAVKQVVSLGDYEQSRYCSSDDEYFDVEFTEVLIDESRDYITVNARVDIYENYTYEKLVKEGVTYSFFIPIKPTVRGEWVSIYDITGEEYSFVSPYNTPSPLYYGQRISNLYYFSGNNNWTSYHNLRAGSLVWDDGETYQSSYAYTGDDYDFMVDDCPMSISDPYCDFGSMYLYTVDYTSTPYIGGSMKYEFATEWVGHGQYGKSYRTMDVPVVRADVELVDILLIDEGGNIVDPNALIIGQTVTVIYNYRNNTECPIFVEGYDNYYDLIDGGFFRIEPYSEIFVTGYTITVSELDDIYIWGGVYLEGCEMFNTDYESDGSNNENVIICHVVSPLELVGIDANASYRENTEVVSSFWVVNDGSKDYYPWDSVTIDFDMYVGNKKVSSNEITEAVVPAYDYNLYYVKWKVPDGSAGKTARIIATLYSDGNEVSTDEITNSIVSYDTYTTPDTEFEKEKPKGYTVPTPEQAKSNYATWWQYEYSFDYNEYGFVKREYGVSNYADNKETLIPSSSANSKLTKGKYSMPSGYAVEANLENRVASVSGYIMPSTDSYTNAQYYLARFPEFGYQMGEGLCKTLVKGTTWNFANDQKYGSTHFVPLNFPNEDYVVNVVKSDFWTPAGMITSTGNTTPIGISGAAYNDWFVAHK